MIEHALAKIRGDALADPRHVVETHIGRDRHRGDDREQPNERLVERAGIVGQEAAIDDELEPLPHSERAARGNEQRRAGNRKAAAIRQQEAAEAAEAAQLRRTRADHASIIFASSSVRCPLRRVSGIEIAAMSEIAHIAVTYQKKVDSMPSDLSHSATYSALPPKSALAIA